MPNTHREGAFFGVYAPVDGVQTLVAGRQGLELSESTDTLDATHVDNMVVAGQITGVDSTNDTITVNRLTTSELELAGRGDIVESTGNDGGYTWAVSGVTDNGDGTHTIDVTSGDQSQSIDDSTADGTLHVPSPHGFRNFRAGFMEWEATVGGLILLDDQTGELQAAHRALYDAKRHGKIITLVIKFPNRDGTSNPREEATAFISNLTLGATYDAMSEFEATFTSESGIETLPTN